MLQIYQPLPYSLITYLIKYSYVSVIHVRTSGKTGYLYKIFHGTVKEVISIKKKQVNKTNYCCYNNNSIYYWQNKNNKKLKLHVLRSLLLCECTRYHERAMQEFWFWNCRYYDSKHNCTFLKKVIKRKIIYHCSQLFERGHLCIVATW